MKDDSYWELVEVCFNDNTPQFSIGMSPRFAKGLTNKELKTLDCFFDKDRCGRAHVNVYPEHHEAYGDISWWDEVLAKRVGKKYE